MSAPNLVTSSGPQRTELIASYSVGSSQANGSIFSGSVLGFGPLVGSQTTVVVPNSEVWHIEDIYDVGGPAYVDAVVVIFINGYQQNVQPTLSSINLNVLTRFSLTQTIVIPPAGTFATSIYTLAAGPSTGGTQVVKFKVNKVPL